jgi:hypothetical protein
MSPRLRRSIKSVKAAWSGDQAGAEYRGFMYARPDFRLLALHSGATTHTAQPSAGFVFGF